MNKIVLLTGLFLSLQISLQAQTYYISGTTDTSLGNRALLHNNELKIGNSTSTTERAKNMIKIGDGSYIQIGEWEADNLLSFKASKFNFTNGNVGIGTTSPEYKLDVAGSLNSTNIQTSYITQRLNDNFTYDGNTMGHYALKWTDDSWQSSCATLWASAYGGMKFFTGGNTTPRLVIAKNGNIGIGTTNPQNKLDVAGSLNSTNIQTSYITQRLNDNFTYDSNTMGHYALKWTDDSWQSNCATLWTSAYGGIKFFTGGNTTPRLAVARNGNVGIGTTNPQNKLEVNGIIRATEVKIETGWADFVFNDDYQLKPLSEVDCFIKANKHLPEIPSASEIKENEGVNLGEMQVKLLQKIEELTLYLIQQETTIQELKNEIRELKEK